MDNKGSHDRPWIWLMAIIAIRLTPMAGPIAVGIVVTALAVQAMVSGRR